MTTKKKTKTKKKLAPKIKTTTIFENDELNDLFDRIDLKGRGVSKKEFFTSNICDFMTTFSENKTEEHITKELLGIICEKKVFNVRGNLIEASFEEIKRAFEDELAGKRASGPIVIGIKNAQLIVPRG